MPAIQLIDAHCHLDFDIFDRDREQVLQRAKQAGINNIIIPGTEKQHWPRISKLCQQHKQLHACYGLHPYWANTHTKQAIFDLNTQIETKRPVAIGECGLDFRAQQADRQTQLAFFEAQLDIAENHQLPVVIHAVKATETVLQTIKKYTQLTGMIHSYSGSFEQARQLIELNFYLSIGGSVTYDRATKLKQLVKDMPLSALLLETDAPDQADQKNQGKRNEPAYLRNTANTIATIKNESLEEIARQTTANAKTLFNI